MLKAWWKDKTKTYPRQFLNLEAYNLVKNRSIDKEKLKFEYRH